MHYDDSTNHECFDHEAHEEIRKLQGDRDGTRAELEARTEEIAEEIQGVRDSAHAEADAMGEDISHLYDGMEDVMERVGSGEIDARQAVVLILESLGGLFSLALTQSRLVKDIAATAADNTRRLDVKNVEVRSLAGSILAVASRDPMPAEGVVDAHLIPEEA